VFGDRPDRADAIEGEERSVTSAVYKTSELEIAAFLKARSHSLISSRLGEGRHLRVHRDSETLRAEAGVDRQLLSVLETASFLGVSESWVRRHVSELPAIRVGRLINNLGWRVRGIENQKVSS
jgi:hypothetical protein